MQQKIIFGSISSSAIETFLNNFSEEDFDQNTISVVMKDEKKARAIAKDTGPLQGIPNTALPKKLQSLGLPPTEVTTLLKNLQEGFVLVAVVVQEQFFTAAKQLFQDYQQADVFVV